MTTEEIISSLEDQAQDKDRLAGGDPDSVFTADATALIEAAKLLRAPTITPPPNDPLTLDELREMDGEPVWCKDCSRNGIVKVDTKGVWKGVPFFSFRYECIDFCWNVDERNLTLYRCKPEEGTM